MAIAGTRCPLCGALLTPLALIEAAEEIADFERGVLAARCPHCQGYLELQPTQDKLDVGYLRGGKFEVVVSLPCEQLGILRAPDPDTLTVTAADRRWQFWE